MKKPLDYALSLLARRDRSVGEIRQKMKLKGYEVVEIEPVIAKLSRSGLLNDCRFASAYLRYQLSLKPTGRYKLEIKLRQLMIPAEIISETLAGFDRSDEKTKAREAAEQWLGRRRSNPKPKERLARFLAARGFGWEIIKEILTELKV